MSEQKPTAEAVSPELVQDILNAGAWSRVKDYTMLERQLAILITAKDAEIERLKHEHDREIGDFQLQAYKLICELSGKQVDGAGSDAGWTEFTLAEIAEGLNHLAEQNQQQRVLLVEITKSDLWQASSPELNSRVMKVLSITPEGGKGL